MSKDARYHNLKLQRFEQRLLPAKYKIMAGVDEAGRGPLAGPVVACAVIIKKKAFTNRIFDSKKLSYACRQKAFTEIIEKAHIGVGVVNSEKVDKDNILQATIIAINKALDNLGKKPQYLLIDGKFKEKSFSCPSQSVVGGDRLCFSIACASIVAKVFRDSLMSDYSAIYPGYGFRRNRGYYTREHIWAIKKYGLTPIHRRSFHPIRLISLSANLRYRR